MVPPMPDGEAAVATHASRHSLACKYLIWPSSLCGSDGDPSEELEEQQPQDKPTIVPFDPLEPAVKYQYCSSRNVWVKEHIFVRLSPSPLAQGSMRHAYPMVEFGRGCPAALCVAKLSKLLHDPRSVYFSEVRMQAKCSELAEQYNRFGPPKKVEFVEAWVVEVKRRRHPSGVGNLVMVVEPRLSGKFLKYNNNLGFVAPGVPQDTPHAFCHFTFHLTRGALLVCDIQGVGHTYTDPQIHSNTDDGWLYGKGDFGRQGIESFFETHCCNDVCRTLRLPQRLWSAKLPPADWDMGGTVPEKVVKQIASGFWCSPAEDPPEDTTQLSPIPAAAAAMVVAIAAVVSELLVDVAHQMACSPKARPTPKAPAPMASPKPPTAGSAVPIMSPTSGPRPTKFQPTSSFGETPAGTGTSQHSLYAIANSPTYPIAPPLHTSPVPASPFGLMSPKHGLHSPMGLSGASALPPNSPGHATPVATPIQPSTLPRARSLVERKVPPSVGGTVLPSLDDFLKGRDEVFTDGAPRTYFAWPGTRLS